MYSLRVYKQAQKELKSLEKIYQLTLFEVLREIQEDPFVGKPLTEELTGLFSYKVDEFRILYKVNNKDKIIFVVSAGHRSTVYK